jgi:hypothetical protein
MFVVLCCWGLNPEYVIAVTTAHFGGEEEGFSLEGRICLPQCGMYEAFFSSQNIVTRMSVTIDGIWIYGRIYWSL